MAWSTEFKVGLAATVLIAAAEASSSPWWWHYTPWGRGGPPAGVVGFSGACAAFQVYAQNRWQPYRAVVRAAPNIDSKAENTFSDQYAFDVNGWVHSPLPVRL